MPFEFILHITYSLSFYCMCNDHGRFSFFKRQVLNASFNASTSFHLLLLLPSQSFQIFYPADLYCITSAVAAVICKLFLSTMAQRLSSLYCAALNAASQLEPSGNSPSPSNVNTLIIFLIHFCSKRSSYSYRQSMTQCTCILFHSFYFSGRMTDIMRFVLAKCIQIIFRKKSFIRQYHKQCFHTMAFALYIPVPVGR